MDAMKIKGSWFRNQTANALRDTRKLLNRSEPIEEEDEYAHPAEASFVPYALRVCVCIGLATVLFIGGCIHSNPAHAEVTEDQAVRILVGEASNQGLKGMVCVAEVLRTRNSVKGFYGLNAKHSHKEPQWVWAQARKAWLASKTSNYTLHADHFENLAFGTPCWVKNCVETFRWKDHVFYREVRNG